MYSRGFAMAALLSAVVVSAQGPPPPPPMPTQEEVMSVPRFKRADDGKPIKFTAATQLVLVPAIVTDASGKAMAGLKTEDFIVLENGKEQKIAGIEHVQGSTAPVLKASAPEGIFTNVLDTA